MNRSTRAVLACACDGDMTPEQIADECGYAKRTVYSRLLSLRRAGMVEPAPVGGRPRLVVATPAGRARALAMLGRAA